MDDQTERQSSEANVERRSIQAYEAQQEAMRAEYIAQQENSEAVPATSVDAAAWNNEMTHGGTDRRVWAMLESGSTNDAWKWALFGRS